jgi:hypothetical protein
MDAGVEIALIGAIASTISACLATVAVVLGAKNKETLIQVTTQLDGQLTETVELKKAVAFGLGEDKQRNKQEMKDAVKAEVKQANGTEDNK